MNLLVNFFEGCNEEIMGKETEGRGFTVKWGEAPLERGDVMESEGGEGGGGQGEVCENPEIFLE